MQYFLSRVFHCPLPRYIRDPQFLPSPSPIYSRPQVSTPPPLFPHLFETPFPDLFETPSYYYPFPEYRYFRHPQNCYILEKYPPGQLLKRSDIPQSKYDQDYQLQQTSNKLRKKFQIISFYLTK